MALENPAGIEVLIGKNKKITHFYGQFSSQPCLITGGYLHLCENDQRWYRLGWETRDSYFRKRGICAGKKMMYCQSSLQPILGKRNHPNHCLATFFETPLPRHGRILFSRLNNLKWGTRNLIYQFTVYPKPPNRENYVPMTCGYNRLSTKPNNFSLVVEQYIPVQIPGKYPHRYTV